ncbi:MAG: hypothetical protein K2X53_04465 [Alphaproteobacteria bacterium]|nr:hypothetical protein [Alphaproteobacteria bacterium]
MVDVYNLLSQKMERLTREKEVYADNILRSPIPGEREKVVKFQSLIKNGTTLAGPAPLVRTNEKHLSPPSSLATTKVGVQKKNVEVSLSGNTINSEEQLRKLNEATTKYYEMMNMYQSYMRRHSTIISGR